MATANVGLQWNAVMREQGAMNIVVNSQFISIWQP